MKTKPYETEARDLHDRMKSEPRGAQYEAIRLALVKAYNAGRRAMARELRRNGA